MMATTYSEDNIHNNHAVSKARTTTFPALHLNCHVADHFVGFITQNEPQTEYVDSLWSPETTNTQKQ